MKETNALILPKSYGFVHEQQLAIEDHWNEGPMYQKLCHAAMNRGTPVEGYAKFQTRTMNTPFGKKAEFDFEVSLVEEIIPSNSNIWNPWIGNGNSGLDAVAQANGIDKTQLSKSHRRQQKKRTWKIEFISNQIRGMEEGTHLNENGILNDTVWLHDLRDRSSVTRTQTSSLKVPTTASWSDDSCNGPAAPFKTMWTRYGTFGILEVSDELSEPQRIADEKKLVFCGEKSLMALYKQKRKRNSTALQLLEKT